MFKEGKSDAHDGDFSRNENFEQSGENKKKFSWLFDDDYIDEDKEDFKEYEDISHRRIQPLEEYKKRAALWEIPLIDKYEEVLSKRLDKADATMRKLYEKYGENSFVFADGNYFGMILYDQDENKMRLCIKNDISNPLGPGSTYFRGVGHAINFRCGDVLGKCLSEENGFQEAILRDVKKYIDNCASKNNGSYEAARNIICKELSGTEKAAISDIFSGATKGKYQGDYWHMPKYWEIDKAKLGMEAFAHMFEASMSSKEKRDMLKRYFPEAFSKFEEMINERCL